MVDRSMTNRPILCVGSQTFGFGACYRNQQVLEVAAKGGGRRGLNEEKPSNEEGWILNDALDAPKWFLQCLL